MRCRFFFELNQIVAAVESNFESSGIVRFFLIELGQGDGTSVAWNASFLIKAGDVFEVPPAMVHKLSNPGIEALRLIFFTPPSHLGEDRLFV